MKPLDFVETDRKDGHVWGFYKADLYQTSRSNPVKKPKPTHSWGSIFRNAIARGYDHGYAAFLADGWEKRQAKQSGKDLTEASDIAKKLRDSCETVSPQIIQASPQKASR